MKPAFNAGMTGETVLITGGARGLGLIFAGLYARRGAKVAICSRTPEDLEHALEKLRRAHPDTRLAGYVADVSRDILYDNYDDPRRNT